jgi:O-antigen ligase
VLEIWILSNCFTNIDTNWLPALSGTYSNLHIHNIIGILWIFIILAKGKIIIPQKYGYLLLLFGEMSIVWLFNFSKFGISSGYISVIYGIFIMIYIASIVDYLNMSLICNMFEKIALIMCVCIICNILINVRIIISSLLSGWSHPDIVTFFGGGVNLEAVWMTMFGVFIRKKWQYRYLVFTSILSAIYLSRTGILVNILLLLIYLYRDGINSLAKNILIAGLAVGVVLIFMSQTGLISSIMSRFGNIGTENGSRSRLNIWISLLQGVKDKPLGIGFGNSMNYLRNAYGLRQEETNAHNIYLQCLLENNIVGLLLMMIGWIMIVIKQVKCRFSNPCGLFLILYTFQGMFQAQLKEPFLFLVLALYLSVPMQKEDKEKLIYEN